MATIFMFASKFLIAFLTTLICYAILEINSSLAGHIITNVVHNFIMIDCFHFQSRVNWFCH